MIEKKEFVLENRMHPYLRDESRSGKGNFVQSTPRSRSASGWAILLTVTVLAAAGCSLPTAFQRERGTPSTDIVTRLGESAWRIELSGYVTNSRQMVLSTLLRRCAEVASQAGYDYFILTGGEVYGENDPQSMPLATYAPESTAEGRTEGALRISQRYHGTALFRAFKGEKPADNPLAFDVREFLP